MSANNKLYRLVLAAMFLALAMVLPFLTGQIREIGKALCPMHIPVLLCGFFCGPWYGLAVGLIAPYLRFALFGMPALLPTGVGMSFELAAYGAVAGFLYQKLPKKKSSVYIALLSAMISGRIVWGIVRTLMFGFGGYEFGWAAFIGGAFLNAIPGIILQLVLVPILVMALEKYTAR